MAAGGCDPPLRNGGLSGANYCRMILVYPLIQSGEPLPERSRRGVELPSWFKHHPSLILITSSKHPFPSSSFPSLLSTLFDSSIRKINLKKPCYSLYGNLKT